jgi:hypothetical protein
MKRPPFIAGAAAILTAPLFLAQCTSDSNAPLAGGGDFAAIRTEIFAKSCASSSCHATAAAVG